MFVNVVQLCYIETDGDTPQHKTTFHVLPDDSREIGSFIETAVDTLDVRFLTIIHIELDRPAHAEGLYKMAQNQDGIFEGNTDF